MHKIFGKRQVVLAALVVALGAAVFLNWYFTNNGTNLVATEAAEKSGENLGKNYGDSKYVNAKASTTKTDTTKAATEESEYFAQAKLGRTQSRDAALETLNKVINNDKATEAAKKEAAQGIEKISANIKLENDIETLIRSKNISQALVIINDKNVEVVVKASELNDTALLQIKETVMKHANVSNENITIIQVK